MLKIRRSAKRPSYLQCWNPYTDKTTSLCWDGPQVAPIFTTPGRKLCVRITRRSMVNLFSERYFAICITINPGNIVVKCNKSAYDKCTQNNRPIMMYSMHDISNTDCGNWSIKMKNTISILIPVSPPSPNTHTLIPMLVIWWSCYDHVGSASVMR